MITQEDIQKLKKYFIEKGTKISQVVSAAIGWSNISGKPSTFPPDSHTHEFNEILNVSWKNPVLSISNDGTETEGFRYIVGASPTGNFSGFTTNDIVEFDGSDWIAETPAEGWMVYDENQSVPLLFNGTSWSAFFVDVVNAQTVGGVKTFSSFPVTPSSAPTSNYEVANKKYVDDNAGGGGGGFWTVVAKTADELRSTNTTYTDDTDLQFSASNGQSYIFTMDLIIQFDPDADFKFVLYFTGTTSKVQYAVADWQMTTTGGGNTFYSLRTGFNSAFVLAQQGSTPDFYALVKINGFFTVTGDGTFSLRWAQNVSRAENVGVLAGSFLQYKEI